MSFRTRVRFPPPPLLLIVTCTYCESVPHGRPSVPMAGSAVLANCPRAGAGRPRAGDDLVADANLADCDWLQQSMVARPGFGERHPIEASGESCWRTDRSPARACRAC